MSNRNAGEIPAHRKPKVSLAMTINQGLGGPKEKPIGVSDGQSVNIPTLSHMSLSATKFSNSGELSDSCFLLKIFQEQRECSASAGQTRMSRLPGKPLKRYYMGKPYRKPTQVGWCKCTKVNG